MRIKSAKSYGAKTRIAITVYLIAWALSTAFILYNFIDMLSFHPAWIGLATFAVMTVAVFRAVKKHHQPFKCPDCGELVESSLENSGVGEEAILFHCLKCDVLWHVGHTDTN